MSISSCCSWLGSWCGRPEVSSNSLHVIPPIEQDPLCPSHIQTQGRDSPSPETIATSSRFLQPGGSWQQVNQQWMDRMHCFSDLPNALSSVTPLNPQMIAITASYIGSDCRSATSIYSIALELINPTISLRSSLRSREAANSLLNKNPESGESGKVKFEIFNNDIVEDRSFAIKRPSISLLELLTYNDSQLDASETDNILLPSSLNKNYSQLDASELDNIIGQYENNLNMTTKIGNHPNFMKSFGVVVKEKNLKIKPYLILENIEGVLLANILIDDRPTLLVSLHLLDQLRTAFTHLLLLGILPCDAACQNILITKGNRLKLIDFDRWESVDDSSENLARWLYKRFHLLACDIACDITCDRDCLRGNGHETCNFKLPPFINSREGAQKSFEQSVDNMIHSYIPYYEGLED